MTGLTIRPRFAAFAAHPAAIGACGRSAKRLIPCPNAPFV
jgi:hypothetical protein